MSQGWQSRSERPAPVLSVLHTGLGEQLERLKQEPSWRAGDRNAITLAKGPHLPVVLIALKKGARLHEHQARGPITIQAASGWLRPVLESAIEHEVEALEESGLLLTLVKPA